MTKHTSWEDKFDEKFSIELSKDKYKLSLPYEHAGCNDCGFYGFAIEDVSEQVKHFISTLLSDQKKQIIKHLEGKKMKQFTAKEIYDTEKKYD